MLVHIHCITYIYVYILYYNTYKCFVRSSVSTYLLHYTLYSGIFSWGLIFVFGLIFDFCGPKFYFSINIAKTRPMTINSCEVNIHGMALYHQKTWKLDLMKISRYTGRAREARWSNSQNSNISKVNMKNTIKMCFKSR